jgi:hypothetical protein
MDGTGTGTGTGDSGSSSDTGGSSSSSTTTGVPPGGEEPVLDACLQCIFLLMGDVNSTGCEEFHAQCV